MADPFCTGVKISTELNKPRAGDLVPIRFLFSQVTPPVYGGVRGEGLPMPAQRRMRLNGWSIVNPDGVTVKPIVTLPNRNGGWWSKPAFKGTEGDWTISGSFTQPQCGPNDTRTEEQRTFYDTKILHVFPAK